MVGRKADEEQVRRFIHPIHGGGWRGEGWWDRKPMKNKQETSFQTYTTSCMIRSRRSGWSAGGVTRSTGAPRHSLR